MDCQKCFTKLQKMKNTQSKIKPIKFGKELGTTYCLGCKDFTYNELDKACFQRDMAYVKSRDLAKKLKQTKF